MDIENRNYTFSDLMYCIGDLIKKYEEGNNNIKQIDKKEQRLIKTKIKRFPYYV